MLSSKTILVLFLILSIAILPLELDASYIVQPTIVLHVINFVIDGGGSVISLGDIKTYPSVNYSCTINKAMITSDQSGSITIDIWKANAAIPTAGNIISASAPVTLSTAQINQNSSIAGWTTSVAVNDVFGFSVASATTVTRVVGEIWCQ
jgi:hypothetical protein